MATKKSTKRKRKVRQEKTIENLEKGMSTSKAMREAGYSEAYAKNPSDFKSKKSYQELLDEVMPRDEVAAKHRELMNSVTVKQFEFPIEVSEKKVKEFTASVSKTAHYIKETITKTNSKGVPMSVGNRWVVYAIIPNGQDLKAALEMAFKVRGDYSPEKVEIKRPLGEVSDNELWDQARKRGLFNNEK